MVFSSITFILYFLPVVLGGYYILFFSRRLQNAWLLIASLFFYGWGEPVYVFVMTGSIVLNWIMGLLVDHYKEKKLWKKGFLIAACTVNLAVLGYFKYTNFIINNINSIFGEEVIRNIKIALPIGISFFTFQAMSYVIDVYNGKAKVQKNPFYLGLYIAFFPQLVAGPIVRYTTVEKQILNRKSEWPSVSEGICRFSEGLLKKILISNNMAIVADHIFSFTSQGDTTVMVPVMLAWVGAIAYTLQLYYDFSAYSDMAIGLGKMFGFYFPENFRHPFTSKSVREFMTKWHISLAAWFNQYVYKPLGGSKSENKDRMIRNLFIVWLLTGIWHGAAWTYIYWGMTLFAFIVLENLIQIEKTEGYGILRHAYVLTVMIVVMVIFRSDSGMQLVLYLKDMTGLAGNGFYSATAVMFVREYWIVFLVGIVFLFPVKDYMGDVFDKSRMGKILTIGYGGLYQIYLLGLLFFCIAVLAKGGYNPFIYFNF